VSTAERPARPAEQAARTAETNAGAAESNASDRPGAAVVSPGRLTLAAFVTMTLIGGTNTVAVRFSNEELAPFWGATLRFVPAALLLGAWVALRGVPLPRGRALVGAVVYGVLNFGLSYALVYYALVTAPAGPAQVVLAVVPLVTVLLATLQGIERFSWRGVAGAAIAAGGIAIVFGDQLSAAVPLLALLALVAAAVCISEVGVAIKWFPRVDAAMLNALGMTIGAAMLLALAVAVGEPLALPQRPVTWLVLAYLVIATVVLFTLVLYVLNRWTASATSYSFLLLPLVSLALAALLRGEPIRQGFLLGAVIVLVGVYVGAFGEAIRGYAPAKEKEPHSC
jgi:drug/metabolite transporter (DMT)-like permease